ncbi:MAG: S9 family peptidase [SAR202 cluster bacterium]|nr:S9 family peptidase [SAR202 cluster bacterium]
MEKQTAPHGSWRSPITTDLIVQGTVGLSQVSLDGEDVYWVESRPAEKGRAVIVRRTSDGRTADVNPPPYNARTRVHEYGGGAYLVADGVLYFSNFADQRLYRAASGSSSQPLTHPTGSGQAPEGNVRYADAVLDSRRRRLICVREDHSNSSREAANTIAAVSLDSGASTVLVSGRDFYSNPRLSPDGSRLAWLQWDHPNMPWDGCELWMAEVRGDGSLGQRALVAGGKDEALFQPEWSPDGTLYFVSDRTGWWVPYLWNGKVSVPLASMEAEFATPQWLFGMRTYAFESARRIVCAYNQRGRWHLASLDTVTRRLTPFDLPFTEFSGIRASPGQAVFIAASPAHPSSVVRLDLSTGWHEVLRRSSEVSLDSGYLSEPQALEFPTEGGKTAHALYYPPKNKDFTAPEGERPPLLVKSHGGPTGAVSSSLSLTIQYWTSRGFAVLDVNYGGSTGYGTAYRRRLDGLWGIVDVDDCVNAARYLVERGLADSERLCIDGGSAGGYTTLSCLTFRDTFKAGASFYGVSDLEALARDTHKFESRYLDRLVGPYPARRDLYTQRSPIHFVDRLNCPVILFQGLEDKVVPPNQAEMMVNALRRKGLPVAYVAFEGEQHGFRKADSIKRTLDGELYFYSRIFGFALADPVEPVKIENL